MLAETFTPVSGLIGGILIGLSAAFLMLTLGRVAGISGIVGQSLQGLGGFAPWFILGLLLGGGGWLYLAPAAFEPRTEFSPLLLVIAGLLVGVGTRMGGGCTSGHGVCGMARLAPRSFVATATFLATGMLTVFAVRHLAGGF